MFSPDYEAITLPNPHFKFINLKKIVLYHAVLQYALGVSCNTSSGEMPHTLVGTGSQALPTEWHKVCSSAALSTVQHLLQHRL